MENIIIGTVGHVDHGNTTLIRALTGIETDTTEEEKVHSIWRSKVNEQEKLKHVRF